MALNSLTDNIFREEIDNDPVVFDLDTTFQNQLPGVKAIIPDAVSFSSGSSFGFPKFDIPNFSTPKIDAGIGVESPMVQIPGADLNATLPPFDFEFGDIPKIDLNTPSVDFQPAIDAAAGALTPIYETSKDVAQVPLDIINNAASLLPKDLVSGWDIPNIDINRTIKKSDGKTFGEIGIGDTGYVIDFSKEFNKELNSIAEGTPLEGVPGQDIIEAFQSPDKLIKRKAAEGIGGAIGSQTGIPGGALAGGVLEVIETGNVGKGIEIVAEQAVKSTAISTVARGIDAVLPGVGVVVEVIANVVQC